MRIGDTRLLWQYLVGLAMTKFYGTLLLIPHYQAAYIKGSNLCPCHRSMKNLEYQWPPKQSRNINSLQEASLHEISMRPKVCDDIKWGLSSTKKEVQHG